MSTKEDDDEPCFLTYALAADAEFTRDANSAAVQIAQRLMSAGFRPCGHTTLGLIALCASAAAAEPHLTEDEFANIARQHFRYHRENPSDPTLVPSNDPRPAETRH